MKVADYLFDKNRRTSLKFSLSYEKQDVIKDSESKQLIKTVTNQTIPNQNEPKPLFQTGQYVFMLHESLYFVAPYCNQIVLLSA